MEAHERIQYLRKEILHISREEFSAQINISLPCLICIEAGETELTEHVLSDICRTFHVNSEWIVSGMQPIFPQSGSPLDAEIERLYFSLTDENKKYLYDFIQRLLENQNA